MKPRIRVLQCRANCEAVFDRHGLPRLREAREVKRDRIKYARDEAFLERIAGLEAFDRWDMVDNHGPTAVRGWREHAALHAMQVVEHTDGIEVDFDLGNPNMGLAPAIVHAVECLWPGKTDSFRVAAGLRRRGIKVIDVREENGGEASKLQRGGSELSSPSES